MYRHEPSNGTTEYGQPTSRTLSSLPPFTVLSTNTVQNSWTRRSKSSGQSDESFSAYLNHPFSSSPAIDRGSYDGGRISAQREATRTATSGLQHRRLPSLDSVGHAHERSSPYGGGARPTPQRSSLRDVVAMHGHDRSASRYTRQFSTPWRGNGNENKELLVLRDASPWHGHRFHGVEHEAETQESTGDALAIVHGAHCDDDDDGDDVQSGEEDDSLDLSNTLNNTQDSSGDLSFLSDDKDKKKRRRTNRSEARVLSAVFEKTAFPDQATREALASRLRMSVRAVSIWFQNRRQAVKKRASRFGGMEGVCGTIHGHEYDDQPSLMDSHLSKQHGHRRLKRWLSLDEVAARAHTHSSRSTLILGSGKRNNVDDSAMIGKDLCAAGVGIPAIAGTAEANKSCAPILDLLRRKASGKTLTRIASMPCFAATFGAKKVDGAQETKKDLRYVLDDIAIVGRAKMRPHAFARSASMTVLPSSRSFSDAKVAKQIEIEVKEVIDVEDRVEPLDIASQAPIGRQAEQTDGTSVEDVDRREIWKRMKSSSSCISSENNTPESDKENRPVIDKDALADDEGFEDEEQTLRRIAMRRASKQEAKREQKLSVEGVKYLQEADARLVLQQQKKKSFVQPIEQPARTPLAPLSVGRTMIRSTSEGTLLRGPSLIRVPSLDFEAGRDRSKEVMDRPVVASLSLQQRLRMHAARSKARRNEPQTARRVSDQHQQQGTRRARAVTAGRHSLPDNLGSRTFKSVKSMPLIDPQAKTAKTAKTAATDDSCSAISLDSRTPSEGSSAEWADEWSRERLADGRSALNVLRVAKRKSDGHIATASADLHDDSGFFGSDEASDDGPDENADPSVAGEHAIKRSRLSHGLANKRTPLKSIGVQYQQTSSPLRAERFEQLSSSPSKKGDERDRLAAETLLAFGSFA